MSSQGPKLALFAQFADDRENARAMPIAWSCWSSSRKASAASKRSGATGRAVDCQCLAASPAYATRWAGDHAA